MLPPGCPRYPLLHRGYSELGKSRQRKRPRQKYLNPRHVQGCSFTQRSKRSQPQPFYSENCPCLPPTPPISPCANQQLIMNTHPSAPGQTQHTEGKVGAPGGSPSPFTHPAGLGSSSTRLSGKSHQSAANRQGLTDNVDEAPTSSGHPTPQRWADPPAPQSEKGRVRKHRCPPRLPSPFSQVNSTCLCLRMLLVREPS